jgi:1-acyl-sn-glycerol-3-phosphate acyltransferase
MKHRERVNFASGASESASEPTADNAPVTAKRLTLRNVAQMIVFALAIKPFMALFIGLRVRGREHLAGIDPFILIANHSSHLDTISLLSLFALNRLRHVRPVAAADYFERNAFVSLFTKTLFNILPIARKNITPENNPLRRMREAIEAGDSIIIFPEGTRGSGPEMGEFRSGVAHLIEKLPGVPVVPAYLVNMGRSLPKGEFIPVPFFCEIRIGERRVLQGSRHEITRALEAAVRELAEETSQPVPD